MLEQGLSDTLWRILGGRPAKHRREYKFTTKTEEGVTVETFEVWVRLKFLRRAKKREYHRMVRPGSGNVLYDQLDDVRSDFVSKMLIDTTFVLVPDIRISPERANKLLATALEEQREVDKLIAEARV